MELWEAYNEAKDELKLSLREMQDWGLKLAQAEHDYKILLRQEVLKMKADGIAVGIIDKTCYGLKNVAEARLMRDIASTSYETAKEKINAAKLNIKMLDSQMNREWSSING